MLFRSLPDSLRHFSIKQKYLHVISSHVHTSSQLVIGNGALFHQISKQCPLLDSVHLSFDTRKMSSTYQDVGVLGLDGFSNILDFCTSGNWAALSTEEYSSFTNRNPSLTILDIHLDSNLRGNCIILAKSKMLKVLRLRCAQGKHLARCKQSMYILIVLYPLH